MRKVKVSFVKSIIVWSGLVLMGASGMSERMHEQVSEGIRSVDTAGQQRAYFAAGCFWGVEAIFSEVDGVVETAVGYMNGDTDDPTYEEVCYKNTGHAEAVEVMYDPSIISYESLCQLFWRLHDPTTLNRQGPDVGSQYRSGIFYQSEEERAIALAVKQQAQVHWNQPIVTEILPAARFYKAEDYHQDYLSRRGISHTGCHFLRDW
jgi:peptide-methionine (S)-S-oxide reductase